jgi:hypothetical protein
MTHAFTLRALLFVIDGQVVQRLISDDLSERSEIRVYSGPVPEGDHTIQALIVYFGECSHANECRFDVRTSHKVRTVESMQLRLVLEGFEKGLDVPEEQRPKARWAEELTASPDDAGARIQGKSDTGRPSK